jgi:DeoR family transcriptional regulator, fructose operon transcriptional repressor
MSHSTRQQEILGILENTDECSIERFAEKFGVSGMTIRRDLETLAKQGRIIRTHGGAVLAAGVNFEFAFLRRTKLNQPQKRAIGQLAAALVGEGQSVLLDSGTTTLAIAERLRTKRRIKVITTSLPIASMLQHNDSIELNLLGGRLRAGSPDLSGALTESNLDLLCADIAFVGADAIDGKGSVFTDSADLPGMLTKMIRSARIAYIVADSTKLGRTAVWRFGDLKQLGGMITDSKAPASFVSGLARLGIKVIRPSRNDPESRKS